MGLGVVVGCGEGGGVGAGIGRVVGTKQAAAPDGELDPTLHGVQLEAPSGA